MVPTCHGLMNFLWHRALCDYVTMAKELPQRFKTSPGFQQLTAVYVPWRISRSLGAASWWSIMNLCRRTPGTVWDACPKLDEHVPRIRTTLDHLIATIYTCIYMYLIYYICMHIYICIYTYTYIHICTYVILCIYIYPDMWVIESHFDSMCWVSCSLDISVKRKWSKLACHEPHWPLGCLFDKLSQLPWACPTCAAGGIALCASTRPLALAVKAEERPRQRLWVNFRANAAGIISGARECSRPVRKIWIISRARECSRPVRKICTIWCKSL